MKAFANVISSAAMSVALASSALGAEMYPKMYDASYVYKSPAGVCNIRMISDGNGLRSGVEAVCSNVEFSGDAPLHGAASAGTQGYASKDGKC